MLYMALYVPFQVYLFPITTWISCKLHQYTNYMHPLSEVLAGHNVEVSIPGQSLLNRPYPPEL